MEPETKKKIWRSLMIIGIIIFIISGFISVAVIITVIILIVSIRKPKEKSPQKYSYTCQYNDIDTVYCDVNLNETQIASFIYSNDTDQWSPFWYNTKENVNDDIKKTIAEIMKANITAWNSDISPKVNRFEGELNL